MRTNETRAQNLARWILRLEQDQEQHGFADWRSIAIRDYKAELKEIEKAKV